MVGWGQIPSSEPFGSNWAFLNLVGVYKSCNENSTLHPTPPINPTLSVMWANQVTRSKMPLCLWLCPLIW